MTEDALREQLVRHWGLAPTRIEPLSGGMNSTTWLVTDGASRWVAKLVPPGIRERVAAGLTQAALVDAAGVPAGASVPALEGQLLATVEGHGLALLTFVEGSELVGDDGREQLLMGRTLARAHRALAGPARADAQRFHWLDPDAPHLGLRPWLRPAVVAALAVYEALPPSTLTWGGLHSDPAPEAFLLNGATGVCGLIDWDSGLYGPLMYDVASAVMYLAGPARAVPFVSAYVAEGVVTQAEVDRSMRSMLSFRWAVQADYFARRISENDLTGISGPEENEEGLLHARLGLEAFEAGSMH